MPLGLDPTRSYPEPFVHWLASYPRSGNTWIRAFLSAYTDEQGGFSLNRLADIPGEPALSQCYMHWPSSEPMTLFDLACIRALVIRRRWEELEAPETSYVVKAHSANIAVHGQRLFPLGYTLPSVYVMRDPRDVLVSFSHFTGKEPAVTLADMTNRALALHDPDFRVFHFVGAWDAHVRSWTEQDKITVAVVRYEDLLKHPESIFAQILKVLGIGVDAKRVARAVKRTSFGSLRQREKDHGFREKPAKCEGAFFRKGKVGQWRTEVPEDVLFQLEKKFWPVMVQFGYEPEVYDAERARAETEAPGPQEGHEQEAIGRLRVRDIEEHGVEAKA